MHRIDTPDALAGLFAEVLPNFPTQVDIPWLNAIQEEIAKTIEGAGLTLRASGAADEGASYASQLLEAIKALNPVKAWMRGRVAVDGAGNFSSPVIDEQEGVTGIAVTGSNQLDLTVPGAPSGLQAALVSTHQTAVGLHSRSMHPVTGGVADTVSLVAGGSGAVATVHFTVAVIW